MKNTQRGTAPRNLKRQYRQKERKARKAEAKARARNVVKATAQAPKAEDNVRRQVFQAGNAQATYKPCHSGNVELLKFGNASLYVGGWIRGAKPERLWAVIDLTGLEEPNKAMRRPVAEAITPTAFTSFEQTLAAMNPREVVGPWLSLPITDFSIPTWGSVEWTALVNDIRRLMMDGTNVLIACCGGHGRTGMTAAIVAYMLDPRTVGADPVAWVRRTYCDRCVETRTQATYVYTMLGLPVVAESVTGSERYDSKVWDNYTLDNGSGRWITKSAQASARVFESDVACRYIFNDGLVYDELRSGEYRTYANRLAAPQLAKTVPVIFCGDEFAKQIAQRAVTPVDELPTMDDEEVDALVEKTLSAFEAGRLFAGDHKCPRCGGLGYVENERGEAWLCTVCDGWGEAQSGDFAISAGG